MARGRVGTSPDVGRIAKAVRTPGIDPRVWCSEAIVKRLFVDAIHGPMVDVVLIPDEVTETARLGAIYSGPGYGLYFPIDVDDTVIVIAPSGDPDQGMVALPRTWCQGDPPPADAVLTPADVLLFVKPGANVRVVTSGAGNVVLDPRGTGKVLLGGETGTAPVARVGDEITITQTQLTAAGATANGFAVAVTTPLKGTITTGATKTEAK